jgi:hypothetical protein
MTHRSTTPGKFSVLRRLFYLLPLFAVLLAPLPVMSQDEEKEEPKPQKEWVVGYALLFLPMAGAMFFMFRMNKRHEFKLKKSDDDE